MYSSILAAVLIAAVAEVAPQASPAAQPGTRSVSPSLPSTTVAEPFSKLFGAPAGPAATQWRIIPGPRQEPQGKRPRTKVVCGMTLILVDPADVDPKMPIPTPKPDGARFTMRNFPAPACKDK